MTKLKTGFLALIIFLSACSQVPSPASAPTALSAAGTADLKITTDDNSAEVYKKAIPSVVAITVTSSDRIHRRFVPIKGEGSGVIISNSGFILTNYHVVKDATKLNILLSDNRTFVARTIATDPPNDLAVIKIDADLSSITPLSFGNSAGLEVGARVFAIGNPFGLAGTLTDGIVSYLDRELTSEEGTRLRNLIQTDAAINPGNSGGPLLNKNAEIVGINTAIFSTSGGNIGIGFAIPISKAAEVIRKASIPEIKI